MFETIEIFMLVFLIIGAATFAYQLYGQKTIVLVLQADVKKQTELKDNALLEISKMQNEALAAYKQSVVATGDRELLIELVQLIWDARDTEAAARCVRTLVSPSVDGAHYTIEECYANLHADLDLVKK